MTHHYYIKPVLQHMVIGYMKHGTGQDVQDWPNTTLLFPECPLFGGKNTLHKCFVTKKNVRYLEFRGDRFSEVANVLQVWDF